ncbi:MAG TPA: ABC transporter permease [Candidatus Acidoferrales bacterium]|nr:ABC transporter permease [Candidatus Acidoferrales bacterium]
MFSRRNPDDFNAEVEAHLRLEADRLRDEGLSDRDARDAARRSFGNLTQARERFYERGRWLWWDHFARDLRFGLRTLAKNPGFAAVAVLTLALGVGSTATVFSWIRSTLLDPIPGASRTSEIVSIARGGDVSTAGEFSWRDFQDLRSRSHTFSGLIAFGIRPMNLTGIGKPLHVWGTAVTANYFDVLGVHPLLGRGFLPAEDRAPGAAPVVVLSYALWQKRFGGDPQLVGRTVNIDQHPFTVVGIAPPEFQGSLTGLRMDLWVPLMMQREVISNRDRLDDRGDYWLMAQGRLATGVAPGQAREELNVLMQQLVDQFPDDHYGHVEIGVYPLWRAPNGANAHFYILFPMLLALAGVVLLLACANVANLLLVRSVARRREIAIRLSMGAGRARIIRQLLAESAVLALAAGGLAMLIARWSAGSFQSFVPPTSYPVSLPLRADSAVLFVTLALALLTVLLFGLFPALRASRVAPAAVLKEEAGSFAGGRPTARLTNSLVAAQLALSLLLLVTAGLFIRGFRNARRFDPGFNPDHVFVAAYDLYAAGYSPETGLEFDRQLLAKVSALPGVQSATLADAVPLGFSRNTEMLRIEDYANRPHESMDVRSATVGPGYLHTLEIPLLEGRDFTPGDTQQSQRVVIVNQAFAARYWPRQEALGKRIWTLGQWFTVVGIARNSDYDYLNERPQPFLYVPMFQDYFTVALIEARVHGDPLAYSSAVENCLHQLNPDMPLYDAAPLSSFTAVASARQRISGTFVGLFGLLALVLASVGIYAVVAYTTRRRTHEIGIRLALGASRRDVLRLVLGHGFRLTLAGVAAGLVLALAATHLLRNSLFGVAPTDALTYFGVAALLFAVALAACYVPARRAMRVNATLALRHE